MRVVVVGGSGFIGTHLVRLLQEQGHEVAVFSRGERALPPGALAIQGTRKEISAAAEALDAFDPEVVIDIFALNAPETEPVFEFFAPRSCRYVMISSCDVYKVFGRLLGTEPGAPLPGLISEEAPLREKLYPYEGFPNTRMKGYDKIPLEQKLFEMFGDRGVVTRLPMIIGDGDPQHRFRDAVVHMVEGREAILLPEAYANWTSSYGHIFNVVEAIAAAATHDDAGGETFNVGELPHRTQKEWYEALGAQLGWEGEVISAPAEGLPEARAALASGGALEQDLKIDASKIERMLSFSPSLDVQGAVADLAAWEKAHLEGVAETYDFAADNAWLKARE